MASRVLLVGLDPAVRNRLRRALAAAGFSIFDAETLDEAYRLASDTQLDILIANLKQWNRGTPAEQATQPASNGQG